MKVISISTDRNIFKEGSDVRARMVEYGGVVDELHIIVFSKKGLFKQEKISPNVWLYPTNSFSRLFYITDAIRLGKQIGKERRFFRETDLVTVQDPFETGFVGLRISKKLCLPFHVQIHTDLASHYFIEKSGIHTLRFFFSQFIIKRANAVRVVSERIKKSLMKTWQINQEKITVLPIFVDIAKIEAQVPAFNLHAKYPQFNFIILMMSRLESEKNILLALKALKDIRKIAGKAGLIIVGSGSEQKKLKSEAIQLEISENVIFEPWTTDPISYFKTADVFLSTSEFEGYGMSLVEAAVSDCPIVTTDVGLIGSVLRPMDVLFCSAENENSVTLEILKLYKNPTLRNEYSDRAKKSVRANSILSKEEYLKRYKESWLKAFN